MPPPGCLQGVLGRPPGHVTCYACWETTPLWTDKHLWKHYLAPNFVCGGNKTSTFSSCWQIDNRSKYKYLVSQMSQHHMDIFLISIVWFCASRKASVPSHAHVEDASLIQKLWHASANYSSRTRVKFQDLHFFKSIFHLKHIPWRLVVVLVVSENLWM